MADYIDWVEVAAWSEPCKPCQNTRRGIISHYGQSMALSVACWHCVDPEGIELQRHIDSCGQCVEPYKRRGGGQSLIPPQTWLKTLIKDEVADNGIKRPFGHEVLDIYCPMCTHAHKVFVGIKTNLVCMQCGYHWQFQSLRDGHA